MEAAFTIAVYLLVICGGLCLAGLIGAAISYFMNRNDMDYLP